MRYLALAIVAIVLGVSVPAHAQQPGPIAAVGAEGAANSDSIFPLWKSLLGDKKFLPPYGINLVLFDLSGQWDVKNFSVAVGDNEVASVSGKADVHPFTYGARADVWVFPKAPAYTRCVTPMDRSCWRMVWIWRRYRNGWATSRSA